VLFTLCRRSVAAVAYSLASIFVTFVTQLREGSASNVWGTGVPRTATANLGQLVLRIAAGVQGGTMSLWAARVAVFGCFIIATIAPMPAQQIGNAPRQPSSLSSAPAKAKPPRPNPAALVVACSGAFARDSHHLKLTMIYDPKNVDFGEVDAGPGKSMASIIYPNDPKRRLEVWWSDVDRRKDLYLIAINGSSTWTAPGGLRLGLSLVDLEKLNRKPFTLRGFDRDKTATVSDWEHGALAALSGGCKAGAILTAEAKAPPEVLAALPADREFSSADEALRAVRPSVTEILIGY
jgi:hypothetical protein